ncbi:MAG: hypothetical protein R3F43_02655 [bacterium]
MLNACNSARVAEELVKVGVPCAVGTTHDVHDAVAVTFATAFYQASPTARTCSTPWRPASCRWS